MVRPRKDHIQGGAEAGPQQVCQVPLELPREEGAVAIAVELTEEGVRGLPHQQRFAPASKLFCGIGKARSKV